MQLADQPFIKFYPALYDTLGSTEDALIVQMILYAADETGEALLSYPEMHRRLHIPQRTIERRCASLRERDILSCRRSGEPGSRNAWTVHTPRQNDAPTGGSPATLTSRQDDETPRQDGGDSHAKVAERSYKSLEEPLEGLVGTETVEPRQSGGAEQTIVTPGNPPFPAAMQRWLAQRWGVTAEQGEAWETAWRTAQTITSDIEYDPAVHLENYLADCKAGGHKPVPNRWFQFFVTDRDKYIAAISHEVRRIERKDETWSEAEMRQNMALVNQPSSEDRLAWLATQPMPGDQS